MAQPTLKGSKVTTYGDLPAKGDEAPDFTAVKADMSEISLSDYKGRNVVLNIFPSVDTPTCATSVRKFNEKAAQKSDTTVICISADLPFAIGRFCGAEGISNVVVASIFRNGNFGRDYGVLMTDGPLKGILSRAIVVIGEDGRVLHSEQVAEIANEPDYEAALAAI
ncbi:thiol peroxidase [Allohahella sp. A8]|uniref:thiol peroxidase n=1 Tax=Allohahella sp. A8 TaxID=3141461 RepID=UPI000C09A2A8|nr:lipid hydroperoxide peroxidase [Hahellaceae bacterium]|tara:strand:- start:36949 stop:37446 length:498 start_codon:yes stop_codon:yes gene_type:complete